MTQPEGADTLAQLRQRIADSVQPLLMDTLPKPIAAMRAEEVADAVLAVVQPEMDAHEQLHHQLADSLGRPISTPWGDLITAAFRAYRAADLLSGAERERQEAEAALARVRAFADDLSTWLAPDGIDAQATAASILAALTAPSPPGP